MHLLSAHYFNRSRNHEEQGVTHPCDPSGDGHCITLDLPARSVYPEQRLSLTSQENTMGLKFRITARYFPPLPHTK